PATSGTISIDGTQIDMSSPAVAIRNRMAFLTEDRKETGCFLILDIQENMQLAVLQDKYVKGGFVQQGALSRDCEEMSAKLRVKTPNLEESIGNLSGGNQQKVLI